MVMHQQSQRAPCQKTRYGRSHKTKHKACQNTDLYNQRRTEEQSIRNLFWTWFLKESLLTLIELLLCVACLTLALACKYRWPNIIIASVFLTVTTLDLVSWFVIRPITYHCWIMASTAGFLSFCLYTGHLLFQTYPWRWILGIVFGSITALVFLIDLIWQLIRFRRFPNPYWVSVYYSEMIESTTCTYGEKLPEDDYSIQCFCGENGGEKCICGKPPTPDLCTCCECGTEFEIAKQTCFNLGTQVDMPRPNIKFSAEGGKHADPYEPEGIEMSPSTGASKTSVDPREAVPDEPARKWRKALRDHELASIHSLRENVTFRRAPCPLPGATMSFVDDDELFAKKRSATGSQKKQASGSFSGFTNRSGGGGGCSCAAPIAQIFDRSACAETKPTPLTVQYFCDDGPPNKRAAVSPSYRTKRDDSRSPIRRPHEKPRKISKGDMSKSGLPSQLSHLTSMQAHMVDSRLMITNSVDDDSIDSRRSRQRNLTRNVSPSSNSRSQSPDIGVDTRSRMLPRQAAYVVRNRPSAAGMIRNAATVVRPGTGQGYSPRSSAISQSYNVQSPRNSINSSPRNRMSMDRSPNRSSGRISDADGQPSFSPVFVRRKFD